MLSIVTLLNYFYYNALSPLLSILANEYSFNEEQRDYMLGLLPYAGFTRRQSSEQHLFPRRLPLLAPLFLYCGFAEQEAHLHRHFACLSHVLLSAPVLLLLQRSILLEGLVRRSNHVHHAHLPLHSRRHLSEQPAVDRVRDLVGGRGLRHAPRPNHQRLPERSLRVALLLPHRVGRWHPRYVLPLLCVSMRRITNRHSLPFQGRGRRNEAGGKGRHGASQEPGFRD